MNITELARILKISPQQLRIILPKLGYDIGPKAIKINKGVANKIIKEWPVLRRKLQIQEEAERRKRLEEEKQKKQERHKKISIPPLITVREFCALAELPLNQVLAELMKNGVFVSLNEKIDFDTAWLIGSELGIKVEKKNEEEKEEAEAEKLKEVLAQENPDVLQNRPPVIVVMGHVDHGKTKLLDAIRQTNVVMGEAGGITQHIGAYQIERKGKTITFIDTPGHEAFTAMRSRGAKVADIAILVVAADDGVKPQTIEAYRIIEKAQLPIVVAINKIDKPEANIEKTKQELANQLNLVPEDWGGKTLCVPISAKKGKNIDDLLDVLLLVAEMEQDHLKANPNAPAVGTIIESHIHKSAGVVATILIQNGTLYPGDNLVYGEINYGKVRALYNFKGEKINSAPPSMPTKLLGLKVLPEVGNILKVGEGKKIKLKKIKNVNQTTQPTANQKEEQEAETKAPALNVIIKSDVLGSAEAIEESLLKINSAKARVKIIHKGLGNITEGDIKKALATEAIILGFNVKASPTIEELAREKQVTVKFYQVIYHLINDIKEELKKMIKPEMERIELGEATILKVFKSEPRAQILGAKVQTGKIEKGAWAEVEREKEIIERGKITNLQAGKQEVNEVEAGQECGIQFDGRILVKEGDKLLVYKEEEKEIKI